MSEGHARESVRLIDTDTGQLLPDALLPMDPELWDRSRTRLTLLLDPGRIERGLVPHTETGYPLTEAAASPSPSTTPSATPPALR